MNKKDMYLSLIEPGARSTKMIPKSPVDERCLKFKAKRAISDFLLLAPNEPDGVSSSL